MLKLISSVQHISGNKHHNDGNGQFDVMREIILRTFARLFALMGCTTIVTACYGVPYENFDVKMSGRVTDAQTGQPVKGIQVRMTVGSRTIGGDNAVQSLSPFESPVCSNTDADGCFKGEASVYREPDGVMIECFDVDGEANGTYLPKSKVYTLEDGADADIRLERYAD